jgi:ABC-2 type transport system permease protein
VAGFIIRSSAFVTKELVEILRQTRLLLALVLGPFLILLLFGLGFRNEARVLRTLFVVPANNEVIRAQVEQQATTLGPQLDFRGVVDDESQAMQQLLRGQVDAVAVIPDQVEQKIRNSEQPVFRLYHREIDPFQVSYVEYVAQIYVDELNRRVLKNIATEGQQEAADVQDELAAAKTSARAMREAFDAGRPEDAQRERAAMGQSLDAISLSVGASLGVLQGVEQTMGASEDGGAAGQILSTLDSLATNNRALESSGTTQTSYSEESQRSAEIEKNLNDLDTQLADFRSIDAQVLVSPFRAEAKSVTNLKLDSSDFFSPGVIILLLQHLLVTFAALSIVRERTSGGMELFRVAPISAIEALIGKYLSYLFLGAVLAACISALVVLVLGVPMVGSWGNYALVLLAVLFASLGAGFVISLISETTSQAVQYSMLMLLFSIFFSGFFLDLRLMWDNMRILSYAIPATYGLRMLQEIMFRGNAINLQLMGGLVGIGVLLFIISWLLLRRQMKLY